MISIGVIATFEAARHLVFDDLRQVNGLRFELKLMSDGGCVITSPDADWFIVHGEDVKHAHFQAVAAMMRLSDWVHDV